MRLWLKIKIISQFGSQSNFARSCRKSDDWISKIVTGRHNPSDDEKKLIISKLEMDYSENLFFKQKIQVKSEI